MLTAAPPLPNRGGLSGGGTGPHVGVLGEAWATFSLSDGWQGTTMGQRPPPPRLPLGVRVRSWQVPFGLEGLIPRRRLRGPAEGSADARTVSDAGDVPEALRGGACAARSCRSSSQ